MGDDGVGGVEDFGDGDDGGEGGEFVGGDVLAHEGEPGFLEDLGDEDVAEGLGAGHAGAVGDFDFAGGDGIDAASDDVGDEGSEAEAEAKDGTAFTVEDEAGDEQGKAVVEPDEEDEGGEGEEEFDKDFGASGGDAPIGEGEDADRDPQDGAEGDAAEANPKGGEEGEAEGKQVVPDDGEVPGHGLGLGVFPGFFEVKPVGSGFLLEFAEATLEVKGVEAAVEEIEHFVVAFADGPRYWCEVVGFVGEEVFDLGVGFGELRGDVSVAEGDVGASGDDGLEGEGLVAALEAGDFGFFEVGGGVFVSGFALGDSDVDVGLVDAL